MNLSNNSSEDSEYNNGSNIEHLMSILSTGKRTKMHTKAINSWLRKRFPSHTSLRYLLFPEELLQHENIKEIFQSFDRDNSHSLDIGELVKMFKQFNINMSREDLQRLFDVMDKDKDQALNFDEFKNCALSEKGQQIFNQIMKKVRTEDQTRPSKERNVYLPVSFSAMITYISYRSMRQDVLEQVLNENLDMSTRTGKFSNLINLQDLYRKDIVNDETSKLKEKIMMRNSNLANLKVEPLLRQLSNLNMKDFQLKSPELLANLASSTRKSQESPLLSNSRGSILLEQSKKHVGELRKSIQKLQKDFKQNRNTGFNINVFSSDIKEEREDKEDKEDKKEEKKLDVEEEIEEIKREAAEDGKAKAKRLFNLSKLDAKDPNSNPLRGLDSDEKRKQSVKTTLKSRRFKQMDRLMQENLKLAETSQENIKFKSFLGLSPEKKPQRRAKNITCRREKGKEEYKSLDLKEDSRILSKIKEMNKRAIDLVLPRLEEIRKISANNKINGSFQKLPEIALISKK